jgi:hypothetical protein
VDHVLQGLLEALDGGDWSAALPLADRYEELGDDFAQSVRKAAQLGPPYLFTDMGEVVAYGWVGPTWAGSVGVIRGAAWFTRIEREEAEHPAYADNTTLRTFHSRSRALLAAARAAVIA